MIGWKDKKGSLEVKMRNKIPCLFFISIVFLLIVTASLYAQDLAQVKEVIDGDTLRIIYKGKLVMEVSIARPLDPRQIVSFEELLMSQVVRQEALTRLLVEKGLFSMEKVLEMVRVVDRERKRKRNRIG
jgi:hypothetical protein